MLNLNPEQVMVGCRVHVGNTSAGHIPSELRIFQRTVRLEEGVRCWYDIPFTNSEALLADEEFTLTVGPTFSGSFLPRIDNLEIYGRLKDEFGWKEKLDALLDMESQGVPGSLSGPRVRGTKHKALQTVSAPEHVFASVLRLLAGYYLADRLQSSSDRDETRLLSRKKCMPVLEVLFETDRQPLLQSAARHVLRALYPSKDAYYQVRGLKYKLSYWSSIVELRSYNAAYCLRRSGTAVMTFAFPGAVCITVSELEVLAPSFLG